MMNARSLGSALCLSLFVAVSAGCSGSGPSPDQAAAADENEADFGDEVKTKTDAAIHAEIAAAAKGVVYVSEADNEFSLVKASLPEGTRAITEQIVREKLAWYVDHDEDADKPLARLYAQSGSWSEWQKDSQVPHCGTPGSYPGEKECAATRKLNETLARNLRGIKVYYFGGHGSPGNIDGVGVSIVVVGRTPKGNLAGVRVVAVWT